LNSIQEKKIKKELVRLQEVYKSFSQDDEKIHDINKIFEEKFKKCEKHQKIKYFFCEKHREYSLMCNDCCEDHIKGNKDKIMQSDIDFHDLYYFPSHILNRIEERLLDLNKLLENKETVETICDSLNNAKTYVDYNYYYLSKIIDVKFNELAQFLTERKSMMKMKLKENYKNMVKK
jgi:hypothetical protein